VFSRNERAESCRDAANKRYRLGHVGIPLCDELKSWFGSVRIKGRDQFVAVHCRADRLIDPAKLSACLEAEIDVRRLESDRLVQLGMGYGLVNPFRDHVTVEGGERPALLQIFDSELLEPSGPPATVMTNAGDYGWAVEIDPIAFVRSLSDRCGREFVVTGAISQPDPASSPRVGCNGPIMGFGTPPGRGGKITIITGNAPESGLHLAEHLFSAIRRLLAQRSLGDISMPEVEIASLPGMGLSMELDLRREAVWQTIERTVRRSLDAGTVTFAIACNTTQFFVRQVWEICQEFAPGIDCVSLAECSRDHVRSQDLTRVGLIGIRYVVDSRGWSAYREAFEGIDVVTPREEVLEEIARLAYEVKTAGVVPSAINRLRDLIRNSVDCDHIVLALTELSLLEGHLQRKTKEGKTLIDPLKVVGESLARRFIG
jgi:aspartate racemase